MSVRDNFRRGTPRPAPTIPTTQVAPEPAVASAVMRTAPTPSAAVPVSANNMSQALAQRHYHLKAQVHRTMIERINLASLDNVSPDQLRTQVRAIISSLIAEENVPLGETQRALLEQEILNETGVEGCRRLMHNSLFAINPPGKSASRPGAFSLVGYFAFRLLCGHRFIHFLAPAGRLGGPGLRRRAAKRLAAGQTLIAGACTNACSRGADTLPRKYDTGSTDGQQYQPARLSTPIA